MRSPYCVAMSMVRVKLTVLFGPPRAYSTSPCMVVSHASIGVPHASTRTWSVIEPVPWGLSEVGPTTSVVPVRGSVPADFHVAAGDAGKGKISTPGAAGGEGMAFLGSPASLVTTLVM